jgi:predicted dehydrogenase
MTRLKVVIIGAGIGAEHLAGYAKVPDLFQVIGLCDRDTDRAKAVAAPYTVPIITSIDDALATNADIIDICLPPHMHVPVTLQALRAGKAVICEKPLAASLAEIEEIRLAGVASGKPVFPVFQYRYGPAMDQLKQLQQEGLLGKPLTAALETHWNRGSDYYAEPWRGTWAGEQGGAVLGHAIHIHDLLTVLFGAVRTVSAKLTTRVNPIETEDCAAILFQMENGATATSSVTLGAASDESRLRLHYEGLTAESARAPYAPMAQPWEFRARDPRDQSKIEAVLIRSSRVEAGFPGFFMAVFESFQCQGDTASSVSLDCGHRSIELVSAIYSANRLQKSVTLPITPDDPMYHGWIM